MNDNPLHFTLREAKAHFSAPRTWAGIAIVGAVIGLVGPFNTYASVAILPRLFYWLGICAGSYAIGFFSTTVLSAWLEPMLPRRWLVITISGLLPGLPIAGFVILINLLTFGLPPREIDGLLSLFIYCPLISLGITAASYLVEGSVPAPTQVAAPPSPALLDRLPHPQRGRLLHIAVADHYVDVTTDKGTSLLLLRLSDAIRETEPVRGLQVHRSHWVALDAVRRATRQAGKPVLELENGTIVPISRSFLPAAKAAGLVT